MIDKDSAHFTKFDYEKLSKHNFKVNYVLNT